MIYILLGSILNSAVNVIELMIKNVDYLDLIKIIALITPLIVFILALYLCIQNSKWFKIITILFGIAILGEVIINVSFSMTEWLLFASALNYSIESGFFKK